MKKPNQFPILLLLLALCALTQNACQVCATGDSLTSARPSCTIGPKGFNGNAAPIPNDTTDRIEFKVRWQLMPTVSNYFVEVTDIDENLVVQTVPMYGGSRDSFTFVSDYTNHALQFNMKPSGTPQNNPEGFCTPNGQGMTLRKDGGGVGIVIVDRAAPTDNCYIGKPSLATFNSKPLDSSLTVITNEFYGGDAAYWSGFRRLYRNGYSSICPVNITVVSCQTGAVIYSRQEFLPRNIVLSPDLLKTQILDITSRAGLTNAAWRTDYYVQSIKFKK